MLLNLFLRNTRICSLLMNKRLKIMQILPALDAGGVECTVAELAAGIAQEGHESIVVSSGGKMVSEIEAGGSRHITLPVAKKSLFTLLQVKNMRRLWEEERPDIVHVHSRVPAWVAYCTWLSMPKERCPIFLTTVHGFYSVNFYSKVMTKGKRVITVSHSARRYVLENYPSVNAEKVLPISLGVDTKEYYPAYRPEEQWVAQWRKEFPQLEGQWVLCLPGRLTRLKGHSDFLEVIAQLRQGGIPAHGLIVGGAHPRKQQYAEELNRSVVAKGLSDVVTFAGHRTDLRDVLTMSDVVLSLTQVPESFGRTTLESLALGRPTLGYAHGGVQEQLDVFLPEGNVPVFDIMAVVARLKQWYECPPVLSQAVLSPYTLEDMVGAHLSLYADIVEYSERGEGGGV